MVVWRVVYGSLGVGAGAVCGGGVAGEGRGRALGNLYLHGPDAALHPDEPLHHLPVLVRVEGVGDLVVDVVLLDQVQHDGAAFEHGRLLRLAVWLGRLVDDGRDPAVCYRTRFGLVSVVPRASE